MDNVQANQLAKWAKEQSNLLAPTWPMGSPLETSVLESWKANRPKMLEAMERRGAETHLAHVLVNRFLEAEKVYLHSGMAPTDAREQAESEWLLREPEDDRSTPAFDQTTTSQIQNAL